MLKMCKEGLGQPVVMVSSGVLFTKYLQNKRLGDDVFSFHLPDCCEQFVLQKVSKVRPTVVCEET